MPTAHITVTLNKSMINPFLINVMTLSTRRAAYKVRDRARAFAPVKTGSLRRNIRVEESGRSTPDQVSMNVNANRFYASWQEHGYPYRIYPKRAKFLRFIPKGKNYFVFAKSTRGIPPVHYMKRARDSVTLADFTK